MNNDVVLRNIAKHLPVSTLVNLRHISRVWNYNLIPALKKKHSHISISNDNQYSEKLIQLADVIRSSDEFPFTKFRLDINKNLATGLLDAFFPFAKKFGGIITSLHLVCNAEHADLPMTQLRQLIFECLPQIVELGVRMDATGAVPLLAPSEIEQISNTLIFLPKLRRLKVDEAAVLGSTVNLAFGRLVADVIGSASNLELLELNDGSTEYYRGHLQPGDLIKFSLARLLRVQEAQLQTHWTKLTILKLNSVLTRTDLRTLIKLAKTITTASTAAGMKLHTFETSILCKRKAPSHEEEGQRQAEYSTLIHDLLATQSATLKKFALHLEADLAPELNPILIPKLELLNKLKIESTFTLNPYAIQFTKNPDERFEDTFPALTKFSVPYTAIELSRDVANRFAHSGLTSINLCIRVCEKDSSTFITNLASAFPSLETMELSLELDSRLVAEFEGNKDVLLLNVKEFGRIWTSWPALTTVKIFIQWAAVDLDLDVFVSGVPRTGLERLRHDLGPSALSNATRDSLAEMVRKYKTRPGMRDLKHLRKFAIFFDCAGLIPQLTDLGGYFGVALAPPGLQRLVVNGMGKNLVPEQCVEFIRANLSPSAEIVL